MSQNIFNLYSATVFAEHPVALWNLDDDFSYLSVVGASPVWNITNGVSASVQFEPPTYPVETVGSPNVDQSIETFSGSGSALTTTLTAQQFNSLTTLDAQIYTVCTSSFIYLYDSQVSSIEIGFKYRETESSPWQYDTSEYQVLSNQEWIKLSHTMEWVSKIFGEGNPDNNASLNFYPVIIVHFSNTSNRTFSLFNFSVGQWSEQFNDITQGSIPVPLTQNSLSASFINSLGLLVSEYPNVKLQEIDSYGFSNIDQGYYVVYRNKMLARNTGLPMVFGSGNITEISYPPAVNPSGELVEDDLLSAANLPGVMVPGKGFLHESGKYKELTAEFWLRINPYVTKETKIFGPIASQDGLYIDNENIILKIAHKRKSYFIGKWHRPMLIDIRYNPLFISVLINGDVVISTDINPADTIFPDNSSFETDWLGFFGNKDIENFELDCMAIYPYIVPEQVAKRRFVYGQGVGKSEEIAKRFSGISLGIDFPFADYTYNLIYPDMSRWDSGFYSNINANSRFISLPEYNLPEIRYVGDDLQPFQLARVRRSWLGIREEGAWDNWRSGVWRAISQTKEANTLVDNYDSQSESSENFYIKLTPNSVYEDLYGSIDFNSISQISENVASIIALFSINRGELLDIQNSSQKLTLLRFTNRATGDFIDISINIENEGQETIDYYYNQTLVEQQSFVIQLSDRYFAAGIDIDKFTTSYSSIIKNFFAIPQNIGLSVGGQDRNEFPGKIFKVIFNNKLFTDKDLGNYFKSDGSAKCTCSVTTNYFETLLSYTGNYTLIFEKANSSMIMDIAAVGYWEDSIPLSQFGSYIKDKSGNTSYYDLDALQFNIEYPSPIYSNAEFDIDSSVKAYLTVQRFNDVGNINYSNYTVTKDLNNKKYIDLDNNDVNLDITKFRIVDGTIIFPPKTKVDFKDAYITIHLELSSKGTINSPIKVQRMSLSSIAFDRATFYELGTPTGNKFYPFTRQGPSYTNKIKNPFVIYKDTTPYLYLTGDSGITTLPYPELENQGSTNLARGLAISINPQKQENYLVHGISFWAMFNKNATIDDYAKIFSIYSTNQKTNFYIDAERDLRRGKLKAFRYEISGEQEDSNVEIYQNGIKSEAFFYPGSWSFITIRFKNPIEFDESIGQLEFYNGIIFNNVTLYVQDIEGRVDDIFESYLGLSNVIAEDTSTLSINSDGLDLFSDVQWTIFSGKPV